MERTVIDVSDYQSGIDWSAVRKEGITGAIVKLTEGQSLQGCAYSHVNGAIAQGLDVGVYVYSHASKPKEAKAEALKALELIRAASIPTTLGIWMDFESTENLNVTDPAQVASDFISTLNAEGYEAGVYASLSTFIDVMSPFMLADYVPYWCAQYASRCEFPDYFRGHVLRGWQYSDKGYIGGMAVDMNRWYT